MKGLPAAALPPNEVQGVPDSEHQRRNVPLALRARIDYLRREARGGRRATR